MGHPAADQAAAEIRRWVAHGVPDDCWTTDGTALESPGSHARPQVVNDPALSPAALAPEASNCRGVMPA